MKKKHLNLLFLLFPAVSLIAQPTIISTDLTPNTGESFVKNLTDYQTPPSGGSNVTWDLSSMVSNSTQTISYVSPNSNFPLTNRNQSTNGTTNQYFEMNSTGWFIHGVLANGVTITYQDPLQFLKFSMTMGTSYTDDFIASFNSSGYDFVRSGTITSEVDGYGTLITPEGTFTNVLRVHYIIDYSDVSDFLGELAYNEDSYIWYKAGQHIELASLSSITTDFGPTTFGSYAETTGLGISEEENMEITIYPNPANEYFIINNNDVFSEISLSDLNGTFLEIEVEKNIDKLIVSTENIPSGVYLLHLKNLNGFISVRKITIE